MYMLLCMSVSECTHTRTHANTHTQSHTWVYVQACTRGSKLGLGFRV